MYDAFVSYSHHDEAIASALQIGLQRLSRPWYRRRPFLRVLRDTTSFRASSDLGDTIRDALDDSRHLVVLLSPDCAQSPWVDEEVGYWLRNNGVENMTMVVTEWDSGRTAVETGSDDLGDFQWDGEDVPLSLRGELEEPLAVDLRWVSTSADMSLEDARFRDAVAEIAAAIKNQNKDELVGEIVAMRTRARILTGTVLLGIVILGAAVVAAGLGWWLADRARDRAFDEQVAAEAATEIARQQLADTESKISEAEAIRDDTEQVVADAISTVLAWSELVPDACSARFAPDFDPEACIDGYEDKIVEASTVRKLLADAVTAIDEAYEGIELALS